MSISGLARRYLPILTWGAEYSRRTLANDLIVPGRSGVSGVGKVAGGASCAARLRRLEEKAEILMVEHGPHVSYANCGLPYHGGGVIEKESTTPPRNHDSDN